MCWLTGVTSLRWTDLQMVDLTLRVLFRPEPSQLPNILRRFGTDYDQRVLPSIVNETLKAVVVRAVFVTF
jgi:hypothetical protein